jgi:hypothetical protein
MNEALVQKIERFSRSIAAYFAIFAKRGRLCNETAQSHFLSRTIQTLKTG